VIKQGARMTGVIKKLQESQTQQMEMITIFGRAMLEMMKNNPMGN